MTILFFFFVLITKHSKNKAVVPTLYVAITAFSVVPNFHIPGRDSAGDSVLVVGGDPSAGEGRDSAGVRTARVCHHGEDAEVWRRSQDLC